MDLYFYLNGTLTGTDSHLVEISGWQSWTRYDNGVIFPVDWNARLHVENHGNADLIDPLIIVVINQNEYQIQKPTVKVGQSLNVDIPLADKFAAPFEGVGTVQIVLQAQGRNPIYLNRTFRLTR